MKTRTIFTTNPLILLLRKVQDCTFLSKLLSKFSSKPFTNPVPKKLIIIRKIGVLGWNKGEIEKLDRKIDEKLYKLYNLTPEEIEIVEKG